MFAFLLLIQYVSSNFIANGNFDSSSITCSTTSANSWAGLNFRVTTQECVTIPGFQGQYMMMVKITTGENGYIEQNVILPQNGLYILSYLQKAPNTNYLSYVL